MKPPSTPIYKGGGSKQENGPKLYLLKGEERIVKKEDLLGKRETGGWEKGFNQNVRKHSSREKGARKG